MVTLILAALANGFLLNSLSTGDWYHVILEMYFFLSLCILNLYLTLISISEWENKACLETQGSSCLVGFRPPGGAFGGWHTHKHVFSPTDPPHQGSTRSHSDHIFWNLGDFKYSVCSFVIYFLSHTLICSPASAGQRGQPDKLMWGNSIFLRKPPAASWQWAVYFRPSSLD